MLSSSLALLHFDFGNSSFFFSSGGFFVCLFVRMYVPPLEHPARPEAQPARPEAKPAMLEAQPARSEAQPASQPSFRLQAWLAGWTDGRTDGKSPHSTGLCPLLGPLPCPPP